MTRALRVTLVLACVVAVATAACARSRHHHRHHHHPHGVGRQAASFAQRWPAPRGLDLVTVPTAAGIDIRVDPTVAERFQGFIADIVAAGYRPGKIHCYSLAASHVAHSAHFTGRACDFDQRGWGKTAPFMYHATPLACRWGLRDGAAFRDWGHIDARTPWRCGA